MAISASRGPGPSLQAKRAGGRQDKEMWRLIGQDPGGLTCGASVEPSSLAS